MTLLVHSLNCIVWICKLKKVLVVIFCTFFVAAYVNHLLVLLVSVMFRVSLNMIGIVIIHLSHEQSKSHGNSHTNIFHDTLNERRNSYKFFIVSIEFPPSLSYMPISYVFLLVEFVKDFVFHSLLSNRFLFCVFIILQYISNIIFYSILILYFEEVRFVHLL